MTTAIQYISLLTLSLLLNCAPLEVCAQPGNAALSDATVNKGETKPFKITRRLEDGTVIYPDGTVKRPDGTVKFPDGRVKKANGSVHYPDGRIIYPGDNRKGEKWIPPGHAKKLYGEKSARSFAPGQEIKSNKKYQKD